MGRRGFDSQAKLTLAVGLNCGKLKNPLTCLQRLGSKVMFMTVVLFLHLITETSVYKQDLAAHFELQASVNIDKII